MSGSRDSASDPAMRRPDFAAWMGQGNSITQQFLSFGNRPGLIALSGGLPAAELYPVDDVQAATERALATHGSAALSYGAVEGFPELRETIARRLSTERLKLTPENVLITTGSLQAVELIGKALIDAGDAILAEYPTYLGALDAWLPRQPRYAELAYRERWPEAKFAYVVPNFSNPTGAVLARAEREALLARSEESGIWLVEDDPYGELRYDGAVQPSLLEMSARPESTVYDGPVVHLGTLSKTIAPGLRVGWAVGAPEMIRALAQAKQGSDLSTSTFCQAVSLELIRADADRRHVPTLVDAYRERRDALCAAAQEHLSDLFDWKVPEGGMFVWMTARRPGLDTNALLSFALEEGVSFVPGSVFDPSGQASPSLRLNFTANPPERLQEGVRRLSRAVRAFASQRAAAE
ncbi:PLP-dependent aminotransferase family protein [Microvirga aerilata]|uniref:8-amino-7-oxononanoate synthase n=1 Tax=Microvirga aerilata TaxID=670292 RepID=A0A937CZS2_9HYPH|nr:PLP-dependent aminotransferase family protein [Microvirga aerilata]MBL0407024.1 PLP-dependent aminotransferase family protein [Microvirga aerilata]